VRLVRLGELRRDDIVLLHSAAGGVGLNALAILTSMRAPTIATVGGARKRAWLVEHRGLAPEQVIVRDRRVFGAYLDRALSALGAKGLDLVFDAIAGPYLACA
jgi:NADPH:quinone reductase-like Zn-dependent oxidoreductase